MPARNFTVMRSTRGRTAQQPAQAVLRARVSSREQEEEGFSLPAQIRPLRDYAARNGFVIVREPVDVETSKTSGRAGFNEMVAYLKTHSSCRTILVEKTDRLYRNIKDWAILDELGVMIHFVKENDFAYTGLVRCGHWGCMLVGELKEGRYVYYHCTGNRGKCGEPYTRQQVLTSEFANILQELVIPQPILEWLGDAVLTSDPTEQGARTQTIKKLQARYDQIQERIETMYLYKLDGRITQEFFDKHSGTWRGEQDSLLRKIQDIQKTTPAPIDQAVDMLRLTSQASELFLQQPAGEQRRLLQWLSKKPLGRARRCGRPCSNRLKSCAIRTRKVIEKKRRMAGQEETWEFGSFSFHRPARSARVYKSATCRPGFYLNPTGIDV